MRCNGCLYDGVCWAQIEEAIEDNETSECFADANNFVKVVRCKDCKKGEPMVNGCVVCTRRAYKSRGLIFGGTQMLPDDYCSYGEPNCGADMRGKDDGRT